MCSEILELHTVFESGGNDHPVELLTLAQDTARIRRIGKTIHQPVTGQDRQIHQIDSAIVIQLSDQFVQTGTSL